MGLDVSCQMSFCFCQRVAALFGDALIRIVELAADRELWEKPQSMALCMLSSHRSPRENLSPGDNPGICPLEGDLGPVANGFRSPRI
jgi:hypothetical protein